MNSLEAIASLTANGCGIGILPNRVATSMYPEKLKRLSKAPVYSDEICLIYRNENRDVQAVKTISKAIKDFFNSSA